MASCTAVSCAQEPVTYRCSLCHTEDGVRWYCNNCQENLCERCKEFHLRGKKTKNDEIVSIGQANRQDDKPVPKVCKVHPGKLCDMYCCDCDILMCLMCFSQTHNQHTWKHFEDEFRIKRQLLQEHMTTISAKITHFKSNAWTSQHCNKAFKSNIDIIRTDVDTQRAKIKSDIDSIADSVLDELSSLENEDGARNQTDCQEFEEKVQKLTTLLQKAEMTDTTDTFEMEKSLRIALPLYDVNVKGVLPKQPTFVTGSIDHILLTKMLGGLHQKSSYEKKDIDSKFVQCISQFTVQKQNQIFSISPVNDSHAYLSINQYRGLVLVSREGEITDTVKLDFCPFMVTMVGTTDILMTCYNDSSFVYKLSLHNKQVTTFANTKPYNAWDISINKKGEVCVSTRTPDIVVLNQSGAIVRKVTCGIDSWCITCLSSGDIAVSNFNTVSIITDISGTAKYQWTGELTNGQKVGRRRPCELSCDVYGRLFVPDYNNSQVYVLLTDSTQAMCLLDRKHGVINPTAVDVDSCGNLWIGCADGSVYVMGL